MSEKGGGEVRIDQIQLAEGLREVFSSVPVVLEWPSLRGEGAVYSPRIDIAVGPFATDHRCIKLYDDLASKHSVLLGQLHSTYTQNVYDFDPQDAVVDLESMCRLNRNARCFLAIEIDGSGSRKHVMGGAVNSAALARLGLSVATNEKHLRTALRIRRYLRLLGSLGKNTFDTANLMVLSTSQLAAVLDVDLLNA